MDVIMPQLGETVAEGTVTVWHKKPGESVAAGELLFEVSTDKVDTEVPAPASGVLTEVLVPEGETVAVGTRLGVIAGSGDAPPAPAENNAGVAPPPAPATRTAPGARNRRNRDARGRPLSPVVRRLIGEHGIEIESVEGTGVGGRPTKNDVRAFLDAGAERLPAPRDGRMIIPFSKLRRLTADRMVRSLATSPHVFQGVEVAFHRVDAARRAHGDAWKAREGSSLTYLPFIAHALCAALAEYPHLNASVEGESLVVHGRINLGVAVDLGPDGLTVPVIKDADRLSVAALARAVADLASRARARTLKPDDLTEGTYTISNSGAFGTLFTAPIINQPQVAILSTDGIARRPVAVETAEGEEAVVIRPVGILAQSFDHRAVDGAYSAAFLRRLKQIIETSDWAAALG
ncbi:MAG: dihydrolipoyllysine-residue succinyltransferase [Alphaproteobacteria bacterium]|nr:dihydrolipoyllysine-residue succinyltransferase [Alphaproteobacteria bacterium]